jgi:hypothetical protein
LNIARRIPGLSAFVVIITEVFSYDLPLFIFLYIVILFGFSSGSASLSLFSLFSLELQIEPFLPSFLLSRISPAVSTNRRRKLFHDL